MSMTKNDCLDPINLTPLREIIDNILKSMLNKEKKPIGNYSEDIPKVLEESQSSRENCADNSSDIPSPDIGSSCCTPDLPCPETGAAGNTNYMHSFGESSSVTGSASGDSCIQNLNTIIPRTISKEIPQNVMNSMSVSEKSVCFGSTDVTFCVDHDHNYTSSEHTNFVLLNPKNSSTLEGLCKDTASSFSEVLKPDSEIPVVKCEGVQRKVNSLTVLGPSIDKDNNNTHDVPYSVCGRYHDHTYNVSVLPSPAPIGFGVTSPKTVIHKAKIQKQPLEAKSEVASVNLSSRSTSACCTHEESCPQTDSVCGMEVMPNQSTLEVLSMPGDIPTTDNTTNVHYKETCSISKPTEILNSTPSNFNQLNLKTEPFCNVLCSSTCPSDHTFSNHSLESSSANCSYNKPSDTSLLETCDTDCFTNTPNHRPSDCSYKTPKPSSLLETGSPGCSNTQNHSSLLETDLPDCSPNILNQNYSLVQTCPANCSPNTQVCNSPVQTCPANCSPNTQVCNSPVQTDPPACSPYTKNCSSVETIPPDCSSNTPNSISLVQTNSPIRTEPFNCSPNTPNSWPVQNGSPIKPNCNSLVGTEFPNCSPNIKKCNSPIKTGPPNCYPIKEKCNSRHTVRPDFSSNIPSNITLVQTGSPNTANCCPPVQNGPPNCSLNTANCCSPVKTSPPNCSPNIANCSLQQTGLPDCSPNKPNCSSAKTSSVDCSNTVVNPGYDKTFSIYRAPIQGKYSSAIPIHSCNSLELPNLSASAKTTPVPGYSISNSLCPANNTFRTDTSYFIGDNKHSFRDVTLGETATFDQNSFSARCSPNDPFLGFGSDSSSDDSVFSDHYRGFDRVSNISVPTTTRIAGNTGAYKYPDTSAITHVSCVKHKELNISSAVNDVDSMTLVSKEPLPLENQRKRKKLTSHIVPCRKFKRNNAETTISIPDKSIEENTSFRIPAKQILCSYSSQDTGKLSNLERFRDINSFGSSGVLDVNLPYSHRMPSKTRDRPSFPSNNVYHSYTQVQQVSTSFENILEPSIQREGDCSSFEPAISGRAESNSKDMLYIKKLCTFIKKNHLMRNQSIKILYEDMEVMEYKRSRYYNV